MTADELRMKVAKAVATVEPDCGESIVPKCIENSDCICGMQADAAIRVVIEAAEDISESYEPRCDTCPRGVASAIRALLPEEQQ